MAAADIQPLVTVVSVFHNRAAHVAASVESLLAQTWPNLEIILVDDGSTDGTLEAMQRFEDPRLSIVSHPNMGFVRAIRQAIAQSNGAFVAIHGSGDISAPTRIEAQAAVLIAHPRVGVVGCHVENDGDDGSTHMFRPPGGQDFATVIRTRNLFTHGEVMFRRDLYDRVGGYRDYFRFAQDRDLWMRLSRTTAYAIVPEPLYRRRKIDGGVSTSAEKQYLQACLADFAGQCADARGDDGRDWLDRYGPSAALLRRRSPALARRLAWTGARWLVHRDPNGGWPLIQRAWRESRDPKTAAICALAALHKSPRLWRWIGRPLLAARLRSFAQ